ncbi:MAG: metallophosphoesterase [Kiritimatiellales bacterium]|nr:metallophosphoesterase [Kiritimatiellales bacterium]
MKAIFLLAFPGFIALIFSGSIVQGELQLAGIDDYSPADGARTMPLVTALNVTLSDSGSSNKTVTFYGRPRSTKVPGADFTIAVLPDTQFYSEAYHTNFPAQTDWIVNNREALNIKYVAHLGDIVQNGDNQPQEWTHATNALYRLEDPVTTGLPEGIPYGVVPGNHDHPGGTTLYNTYFGTNHFAGKSYYGGHYGTNNQNHFDLISIGSLDFIFLYIDFDYDNMSYVSIDAWADEVLKTHSNRQAIVVSHDILALNGEFDPRGQVIYDNLKDNPNLFLILSGHNHGEAVRQETIEGRTVTCCLSDYQDYPNGGDGFLRLYAFSPSNDVIRVKTYSPVLDQFETDADSQFEIAFDMNRNAPFFRIGSTNMPSGTSGGVAWPGLNPDTGYEWYVTLSDDTGTASSTVSGFTTIASGTNTLPTVFLTSPTESSSIPSRSNLTLTATANDTNGFIARVDFLANSMRLDSIPAAPFASTWTNPPPGEYRLTAAAFDSGGLSVTSAPLSLVVYSLPTMTNSLVPAGATWHYLDDGSDQGTAWRSVAFDDGGWSNGPAELGYGDGDEATTVGYGAVYANKYVTTYYRHAFVASNTVDAAGLQLRVVRDDGIVVYLNGTEIFRNNMFVGTVSYDPLAATGVGSSDEYTWLSAMVPAGALTDGTNVLAVEIHQEAVDSSDISFNLELSGVFTQPAYVVIAVAEGAGAVSPSFAVVPALDNTNFVITADTYHHISDVQTNGIGLGETCGLGSITQTWLSVWGDGELKALFSENLTTNGTPEMWLAAYGLTNGSFDAEAAADRDGDRLSAAEEYIAGTIPVSNMSVFEIAALASDPVDGELTITWPSETARTYSILRETNLLDAASFSVVSNGIAATPPTNTVSLGTAAGDAVFFKVTVEMNP